ncbi:hypothetical protein Fleli_1826 [Bernardetia litoralis DSM 6794]|uniref:Uncharacterized protein n=1 Tax=Bernardetia litoralis (strain ATCC 23117 / DSM 6794 / NBRC 15988 / NCIMB 1366 / Fx l1 / Sio-4) TaxID=880071 RepID=I4AJT9_BERLS|nr:tetratricopeptide repeat protein [Bernardetia litoralis]AFM04224.1 hypothetical protein Fleli_1826 [Bernardetia litoralis DSM 6794]
MINYIFYKSEELFYQLFSTNSRYRKTAEAMNAENYYELQAVLESHLRRGYGYAEFQNWNDAIREFEKVLAIHPNHTEALFGLAVSFYNRWLDYGKETDKYRAAGLARRCVDNEPQHYKAMQLLSQIYKGAAFEDAMKTRSWHTNIMMGLVGIMFLSSGYLGYSYLEQNNNQVPFANQILTLSNSNYNTASLAFDTENSPMQAEGSLRSITILEEEGLHLPVEWIVNPKFEGLKLEVEQSKFKNFNGSYSYNLLADLYVSSGAISSLKLRVELLDRDGNAIAQDIVQAIEAFDPIARKGESIPFRYLEYKEEFVENATLVRVRVEKVEYQENTEINTAPVSLEWNDMSDFNPNILLSERVSNLQEVEENGKIGAFHHFEWEIQNATEKGQVKLLQAEIKWIGHQGQTLDSRTTYFINSSEPTLKANQIRSIGRAYRLEGINKEDIARYSVTIKEIED